MEFGGFILTAVAALGLFFFAAGVYKAVEWIGESIFNSIFK